MTDNNKPIGSKQSFCSNCGAKLSIKTPADDNRLRYVCDSCGVVHYENPKVVVGCVVEHQGSILLCRRAIEPRYNFWTVPAGFMELGETLVEGAERETYEEARARIDSSSLFTVVDVTHAGQAHVFFRGTLVNGEHAAGPESLETRLFAPSEIPWDEIAFASGIIALKRYIHYMETGDDSVHYAQAERIKTT